MDPQTKYRVSITSFTTLISFLKGVLCRHVITQIRFGCQFSKTKISNFHGSISLIFGWMLDETLIFRLNYQNLSPFSRYSPLKFAYHFSSGKFGMSLYRVNFTNFLWILVKNFDALLVLNCAIDAFTAEYLPY